MRQTRWALKRHKRTSVTFQDVLSEDPSVTAAWKFIPAYSRLWANKHGGYTDRPKGLKIKLKGLEPRNMTGLWAIQPSQRKTQILHFKEGHWLTRNWNLVFGWGLVKSQRRGNWSSDLPASKNVLGQQWAQVEQLGWQEPGSLRGEEMAP